MPEHGLFIETRDRKRQNLTTDDAILARSSMDWGQCTIEAVDPTVEKWRPVLPPSENHEESEEEESSSPGHTFCPAFSTTANSEEARERLQHRIAKKHATYGFTPIKSAEVEEEEVADSLTVSLTTATSLATSLTTHAFSLILGDDDDGSILFGPDDNESNEAVLKTPREDEESLSSSCPSSNRDVKSVGGRSAADDSVSRKDKKVVASSSTGRHSKWKLHYKISIAVLCIIGLGLGVAYLLFLRPDDKQDDTHSSVPPSGRMTALKLQVEELSADGLSIFDDETSPQYAAIDWLANDDSARVSESDQARLQARYALATFYFATLGDNWFDDCGFLSGRDECEWKCSIESGQGVYCDESGQVTSLIFAASNNLAGTIPEELQVFSSSLRHVIISNQYVATSDGEAVTTLQDVSNLSKLTRLTNLDVSSNALLGTIPAEFGGLVELAELSMSYNEYGGAIPSTLQHLTSLEALDISYNALSGPLPPALSSMTSLTSLNLRWNLLSETIPEHMESLTRLERLDLYWNRLSGTLPSSIGSLSSLVWLYLAYNQLSGPIPETYSDLESIEYIDLRFNPIRSGSLEALCDVSKDPVPIIRIANENNEIECSCCEP